MEGLAMASIRNLTSAKWESTVSNLPLTLQDFAASARSQWYWDAEDKQIQTRFTCTVNSQSLDQ